MYVDKSARTMGFIEASDGEGMNTSRMGGWGGGVGGGGWGNGTCTYFKTQKRQQRCDIKVD